MLFLTLAVDVVSVWRSCQSTFELPGGVKNLIQFIFDKLEKSFGAVMTRTALGLLAYADGGIRDEEMVDLLSLCDAVLTEIFQYSDPGIKRLPDHVWWRLRRALANLTSEKDNGCLGFCHRQLWETAKERYAEDSASLHTLMGKYFSNNIESTTRQERLVRTQPVTLNDQLIWFEDAAVNSRRCLEASFNLVGAVEALMKKVEGEKGRDNKTTSKTLTIL